MVEPELEGGCLCAQLRYRIRRIHSVYWCHCTMCRRSSGSGAIPWVTVAREDFELIAGTPRAYASSPGVERRFCGTCGSPIVFDMAREAQVDVTVGTLDAPDAVRPTHHIWSRSALHMTAGLGLDLPRYAAERPAEE